MSRLLMLSANLMDDPYPVYPLGADIVASAARQAGHEVRMADLMVDGPDSLAGLLADFQPDFVAVSLRNVENVNYNDSRSFVSQYRSVVQTVKRIRPVPVILGGTAFTVFPEQMLSTLGADYGITGPGEVALPELLGRLEQGEVPREKIVRGHVDRSGNNAYFLHREDRLANFYLRQGGMLNVYTKRGCPHRCLYCSYPALEGERYLFRDPKAVVDEIACLKDRHSADFLFFTDSVFNDTGNRYLEILEEMARRNLSVSWTCYMRPARFTQDQLELMKRSGLHSVEWGTDCSTDTTLRGMGKDFTWEDVRTANNLFAQNGVPGSHFIIFGGPGETPDTVREGLANLAELSDCVIIGGMGVRVFPNTGICRLAVEEGLITSEHELFGREVYYFSRAVEREWLHQTLLEAFKADRRWIYPWSNYGDINRFMRNSGVRGPLWDQLLKKRKR